jgi:chromosome segregation ATPase
MQDELNTLEGSLEVRQRDFEQAERENDEAQASLNTFHEQLSMKKDMLYNLQAQVKKYDTERVHYQGSRQRTQVAMEKEQNTMDEEEKTLKVNVQEK